MAIKVVGLTGGIGSGKSAVADLFAGQGITVVDTDVISRRLTGPDGEAMGPLRQAFGAEYVLADGSMNRTAMRERVFADPAARQRLEAVLHPMIMVHSMRLLQQAQGPYAMLVVPLLFESQRYLALISRSLLVDCDESLQIDRVVRRSGLSVEQVRAIMSAQMPRAERQARADDIILNEGSLDDLRLQVEEKHRYYHAILS
ncbi:MAG: dephospho-CoA kinase [Paludibacterium sp.]|uniref:dephospho-CoA kinase n=1 Tax=Paludibacterium sp. TaxID=1917523 RepID=UPI0025FC8431|nr:dephospho-CoA kinase [Paludibacterium sp.]MBV8046595.1 dephospho-CoA kinase [Paludibacterium sp.]MBV8646026.1 dephospho-CoA kinase [Paludibacterium sp.]